MPVAKIADPSDLKHVMGIVREHANCLPESKDSLAHLLGMLIADALSEFTGEKFDMPRRSGDLDDADGINHLLSDYPSWIYPSGMRAAFLTVEEEAAALLLRKLYLARDFLELGFGLPEETIREIEEEGLRLLSWRQHVPALFGQPFHDNSGKKREVGFWRAAIRSELKKNSRLKNLELWNIIATKGRKGWKFFEKRGGLNPLPRRAEGPNKETLSYIYFSGLCKEERKKA